MVKWFEKFSLNFSISLFVIRANLLHPCSVMVNIIISSLFSYISSKSIIFKFTSI